VYAWTPSELGLGDIYVTAITSICGAWQLAGRICVSRISDPRLRVCGGRSPESHLVRRRLGRDAGDKQRDKAYGGDRRRARERPPPTPQRSGLRKPFGGLSIEQRRGWRFRADGTGSRQETVG
jgi:hypothetical protein